MRLPDMTPERRLVLLDELIGLRMENAELRFRLDQVSRGVVASHGDLTSTWTWRVGWLVMSPVRWARVAARFVRRGLRSLKRRALSVGRGSRG